MAFAAAITKRDVWGDKAVTMGTYTNGGGETGGDINTGLHMCEAIFLQPGGGTVNTNAPVVNETLPVAGSAVSVVMDDGTDGTFIAFGDAHT
jgi:hypothetical protein